MKFEEFITEIRNLGFGIVAMNEYRVKTGGIESGPHRLYVVVKHEDGNFCVKSEGPDFKRKNYEKVFDSIIREIQEHAIHCSSCGEVTYGKKCPRCIW
jgi:hypothetical protein